MNRRSLLQALLASGLVNAWFLVGPGQVASLASTPSVRNSTLHTKSRRLRN